MSAPKKAAKKASAHSIPKHDEGKDLRRAHEHQGRVEALRPAMGKHTSGIELLTGLAEQELSGAHYKDAADLFRAAEHLSFGLLASSKPDGHVDETLAESSTAEFKSKLEKAQEHWNGNDSLSGIYDNTLADAQTAFADGAYRKALELVRAAEALAHVHVHSSQEENTAA